MGYRNRSRIEIIGQILDTVNDHGNGNGVTLSTLMYEVFISIAQLREYLTALTIHGLLDYNSKTCKYHITKKGLRYLQLCDTLCDMIEEEKVNQRKDNNNTTGDKD